MSLPRYTVQIDARALKEIKRLPRRDSQRVFDAVQALATDPYPPGARKLTNRPGWRIRIGDYRVLYGVDAGRLIVLVFRAGHRGDIYG